MVRAWLLSCVALAGCSLGLTGPASGRRLSERPVCDHEKGDVIVDGVLGSGLAVGALAAVDDGSTGAAFALGLLGTGYLLSAVHGNRTVNRCREATASFEALHQPPVGGERMATRPPPPPEPPDTIRPDELISQSPHVTPPAPVAAPPRAAAPAPTTESAWREFWKEVP